jgi:hypothetical protein
VLGGSLRSIKNLSTSLVEFESEEMNLLTSSQRQDIFPATLYNATHTRTTGIGTPILFNNNRLILVSGWTMLTLQGPLEDQDIAFSQAQLCE